MFGSSRSSREGIPSPPCPSREAPGQARPVQLLSTRPLPCSPAPWACLPDVMKREPPPGSLSRRVPSTHTVPWRPHLLVCATGLYSGSRRVLSRGAIPWHGFCCSLCCCPIAQLHPVWSPGLLPKTFGSLPVFGCE